MQKPRKLKLGDTIGLVSPSGPTTLENVEKLIKELEGFGFKVKVGKSPYESMGFLAGTDEIRSNDINEMFKDDEVDGILCVRGGYGTPRLLEYLDYEAIKNNPKLFVGYSDITALHVAFNQICDLMTFHGPMGSSDMSNGLHEFSKAHLKSVVMDGTEDMILKNPEGEEITTIASGVAEGVLIGGNLSLMAATIGTDYEIDTKGKILFIEEVGEEPYVVDRMFNQLRMTKKFKEAAGIILGDFEDCEPKGNYLDRPLIMVLEEYFANLGTPVIYNLQAGHCRPMLTLPFGARVRLDADKKEVKILEDSSI